MSIYRFETTATMKSHNNKKWWIDADIVSPVKIEAADLKTALNLWREKVQDRDYIQISNNAIKNRNPMYIDGKNGEPMQVGFVITGKADFDKGDYSGYSTQYIDLWVTVQIVTIPDFEKGGCMMDKGFFQQQ